MTTAQKEIVIHQIVTAHSSWFIEMSQENPLVNAIRAVDGRKRIVEVRWSELSASERSEASVNYN